MEQVRATVTELTGNAYLIREDGEKVALQEGDELLSGTIIMTEANSQVIAEGPDFRLTLPEDSMTEIPSEPLTESADNAPAVLDAGGDEIAALQAAILEGLDPTQAFEAAAAGIPGAGALPAGPDGEGSGNGGFVTIARIGDERIAEAGFDTAVTPLAFDDVPQIPGDILLAANAPSEDGSLPTPTPTPDTGEPAPNPVTLTPNVTIKIGSATRGVAKINHQSVVEDNDGTIRDTDAGFTITGRNKEKTSFEPNDRPSISVVSPGEATGVGYPTVSGFGVSGQPLGKADAGKSDTSSPEEITPDQTLTVTFDNPVSEMTAQFSWLRDFEYAKYTITKADGSKEKGMLHGITDVVDPRFTIKAADGSAIKSIDFTPAIPGDTYDGKTVKQIEDYRSDFLIHEITFKTADYDYELNISAAPGQTDGSESITSVVLAVPAGASLSHGTNIPGTDNWTLPLVNDGDYQVNIGADGSVTITGITLTMPNDNPPTVVVTAVAQGQAVNGITPPPASATSDDTAAALDKTVETGLTITNSAIALEGDNLEFAVALDAAVDSDTVLHFNFVNGQSEGKAGLADIDTPSITINGVAHGPIVVHADGSYSVTIPKGVTDGIIISVPTIKDGIYEGVEELTLNATLSGENANGAQLTGNLDATSAGNIVDEKQASISIDVIAGDDVVNSVEAGAEVMITGTVGKDVEAGDTVTVVVGGTTYTTKVENDGVTWGVSVSGTDLMEDSKVNATVTTTDYFGSKEATAERVYTVDTESPIIQSKAASGYEDLVSDITNPNETSEIVINLAASDAGTGLKHILITSLPDNGVLVVNGEPVNQIEAGGLIVGPNSLITFEPKEDWSGNTSFNYQAVDNAGNTSEATQAIDVLPVTDKPVVEVTLNSWTLTPQTQTIDINNAVKTGLGFTVKAYNSDGVVGDISQVDYGSAAKGVNGFGVAGKAKGNTGDEREIAFGERIEILFKEPVTNLAIRLSWLHKVEKAEYTTYDTSGNKLNTYTVIGKTDVIDDAIVIAAEGENYIGRIDFTSPKENISGGDNDYLIHDIEFSTLGNKVYPLDIAAYPTDTDGSEKITSIVVKLEEGVQLSHGTPSDTADDEGFYSWELPLADNKDYKVTVDGQGKVNIVGVTVITTEVKGEPTVKVSATVQDSAGDNLGEIVTSDEVIISSNTQPAPVSLLFDEDEMLFTHSIDEESASQPEAVSFINNVEFNEIDFSDIWLDVNDVLDEYLPAAEQAQNNSLLVASSNGSAELSAPMAEMNHSADILEQILTAELLNPTP
ncbi:retention module-containing protein [Oceanisphaera avium]|nr:retention module-containing protein [Oceanisphaera avium]